MSLNDEDSRKEHADRFYDSSFQSKLEHVVERKSYNPFKKAPRNEAKEKFMDELMAEKRLAYQEYLKKKKEDIIEDLGSLTIHGIPNIAKSDGIISTSMWVLITLVSAGFSCYYIAQGISDFLGYDVTTKIRFINEQPAMFPSVTLCNVNPFTTQESLSFLNDALTNGGMVLNGTDPLSTENLIYQTLDFSSYLAVSNAMSPYFSDVDKQKLGFTLEQFVLDCSFNKLPCNLTDFAWFYDFYKGKPKLPFAIFSV